MRQSEGRRVLAALLILLWGVSGCRPGMLYPALPPVEQGEPVSDSSFLTSALNTRLNEFQDLRALVHVSLDVRDDKFRFKEALLLSREPQIRIEALGLLGQPFLFLTSDGANVAIYAADERKYYQGRLTPDRFERFLGLSLQLPQLAAILSGNTPYPLDEAAPSAWYRPEARTYAISAQPRGTRFRQLCWVDADTLVPTRCALVDGRAVVLDVMYGDHAVVNGYLFPHSLVIREPAGRTVLVARYEYARLNSGLVAADFELPVPEGVEVIGLH